MGKSVAFDRDGFALTRFNTGGDMVAALYEGKELLRQAKRGYCGDVRVEDDFPHILGGLNVWGIDNPFGHAGSKHLREIIKYGNIGRLLKDFAGWSGAEMELARLHCGDRFKHQGFWHVDAPQIEYHNSIVAIVYLNGESGFQIVPQCFIPKEQGGIGKHISINANAGDVLLMRSCLWHKGFYTKPRMHLHMRFIRNDKLGFNQEIWSVWQPRKEVPKYQPQGLTSQIKNFVRYMTPGRAGSNHWQ